MWDAILFDADGNFVNDEDVFSTNMLPSFFLHSLYLSPNILFIKLPPLSPPLSPPTNDNIIGNERESCGRFFFSFFFLALFFVGRGTKVN